MLRLHATREGWGVGGLKPVRPENWYKCTNCTQTEDKRNMGGKQGRRSKFSTCYYRKEDDTKASIIINFCCHTSRKHTKNVPACVALTENSTILQKYEQPITPSCSIPFRNTIHFVFVNFPVLSFQPPVLTRPVSKHLKVLSAQIP
jgi:hypothetical protein